MDNIEKTRKAIKDSGMKQYIVAQRAGISSQDRLTAIVTRRRKPHPHELAGLAEVLGIELEIPPAAQTA